MEQFTPDDISQFENLGIAAVILFGSHAQGSAGPMSDFDFGILLDQPGILANAEQKAKIYDALYDVLSRYVNKLVDIDIVFLHDAPLDLQTHVMKHGKLFYESTQGIFANYREHVMETAADFEPYRRMFQASILSRIHP